MTDALMAERSVLGSILVDPAKLPSVRALLSEQDFELPAHRTIFDAMGALAERGAGLDVVTVLDELQSRGEELKVQGGPAYLAQISNETPTAENVQHYAHIVAKRANIRRLKVVCDRAVELAADDPERSQVLVLEAQRLLTEIHRGRVRPGVDLETLVAPMLDELEQRGDARRAGGARLVGVNTTLTGLNAVTGGFRPRTLSVIAARTSLGKTSYACQVALVNAIEQKLPCLFFSLEMAPLELAERFFSRRARVDSTRLRTGDLTKEDWTCLNFAAGEMRTGTVTISTTRTLPGIATEARAFRVRHREAPVLFVVDYLQLVRTGDRGRTREQEVAEVSATLKELAMELAAPFVVPAQLNRGPEIEDREPKVSDIRDSGAVEQDADLVLFIVRKRDDRTGACYGKVGKNRNGAVGDFDLKWNGSIYELADGE